MSFINFLKITDPKIDFIVNEFLKKRQNIQQNFLSELVGDVNTIRTFEALQTSYGDAKTFKKRPCNELKPIREGMKNLPKAITFPQFPSITVYDDDGEEEVNVFIGDIAEQYL